MRVRSTRNGLDFESSRPTTNKSRHHSQITMGEAVHHERLEINEKTTHFSLNGEPYDGPKHRKWPKYEWWTGVIPTNASEKLVYHNRALLMEGQDDDPSAPFKIMSTLESHGEHSGEIVNFETMARDPQTDERIRLSKMNFPPRNMFAGKRGGFSHVVEQRLPESKPVRPQTPPEEAPVPATPMKPAPSRSPAPMSMTRVMPEPVTGQPMDATPLLVDGLPMFVGELRTSVRRTAQNRIDVFFNRFLVRSYEDGWSNDHLENKLASHLKIKLPLVRILVNEKVARGGPRRQPALLP